MSVAKCFLFVGICISCSLHGQTTNTSNNTGFPAETDTTINHTDPSTDDCTFNNNFNELTIDWLTELNIHDFIWRTDLNRALIPKEQDTIFVSKGGCHHFGFNVEIKLTNDAHALADSMFFIGKALELATVFKLTNFVQMISEGRVRIAGTEPTLVWFEIDDDDPEDNLIYLGIEIKSDGKSKKISLTQYYN